MAKSPACRDATALGIIVYTDVTAHNIRQDLLGDGDGVRWKKTQQGNKKPEKKREKARSERVVGRIALANDAESRISLRGSGYLLSAVIYGISSSLSSSLSCFACV